jgi:hypothetical protein
MKFTGWGLILFAVMVAVIFLIPAPSILAAVSSTTNSPASAAPIGKQLLPGSDYPYPAGDNANNTVMLPGGFPLHVPGGLAGLKLAQEGGPLLAGGLASGAALKDTAVKVEQASGNAQLSSELSVLPNASWALFVQAGADAAAHKSQATVTADVEKATHITPSDCDLNCFLDYAILGLSVTLLVSIIVLGCTFGPIGCVIGVLVAALIVAVGIIAYCLTEGVTACFGTVTNPTNTYKRDAAQNQMAGLMGGFKEAIIGGANTTRTILNAFNDTYYAMTWSAANAALSQLPNATFSVTQDAFYSGIIPQFTSLYEGAIGNIASVTAAALNTSGNVYGPNGVWGTQGIACVMQVEAIYDGDYNHAVGYAPVLDPVLTSGFTAQSPACYGESGTPQNSQVYGNASSPTLFPGLYAGLHFGPNYPTSISSGGESSNSLYYVAHDSQFDTVFSAALGSTSGPYVGTQFIPFAGTGTTWYNFTSSNEAFTFTGPNGTYYINGFAGCSTSSFTTCQRVTGGIVPANLIATNIFPLSSNSLSSGGDSLAVSFNVTYGGASLNTIGILCTPGVFNAGVTAPETNANPFELCDPSTESVLPSAFIMLTAATNVGQTYWQFLRGQGYYSEAAVPTRCVIPNPAEIIPPNLAGGAAYLAGLTPTQLLDLYLGYLARLADTFNSTSNLTEFGFCGQTVRCSDYTNTSSCAGISGIGPVPVLAIGDIYIPPAGCVGAIGYACNGENINDPSTWALVNVTQLWEPSTGTLSFVLNETMLMPYHNPADLIYSDNNTAGRNLTCQTGAYNVLGCSPSNATAPYLIPNFLFHVTGNSTNPESSIYPHDEYVPAGPGWAVNISACASILPSIFNGNWTQSQNYTRQSTVCQFNETEIRSWITNDSCLIDQQYCGGCPPTGCPCAETDTCPVSSTDCPGSSSLWVFGSIVNGVANIFSGIPLIGSGVGCFLGYVVLVALLIVLVYVAAAIINFARGRRN